MSPLIATVILIAITASLAVIIFSSGKRYIEQLSPLPDCSNVLFEAGIYKTQDNYVLEVNNKGNQKIRGFDLLITDEEIGKTDLQAIFLDVQAGKSISQNIILEKSTSGKKLEIVPLVTDAADKIVSCDFRLAQEIILTETSVNSYALA